MKPYPYLKAAITLSLMLVCNPLWAQSNLKDAWQAFFDNNTTKARTLFTQATAEKDIAGEAYIGLSLLSHLNGSSEEAFANFKKFYDQSSNAQPYVYALWTTPSINDGFGKKSEGVLAFLRSVALRKDYDGAIAAKAYSMIGNHYQNSKKALLADKEFANIGSIDNWAITADFENISTSGFDKSYETLSRPEDNAAFKNKQGVNVSWHTVPYLRHDKWFDFTYYADADDAIIFAQTFVNSPTEQEVQLRAGVSGSIKIWLNDQLILSEAEERNNDLDTYIQSIKLHSGNNRILVQVGESYAERSNFLLRLTDNAGYPLTNITASAAYQPYKKEDKYVSKKHELFAIEYFQQQLAKNADDYLAKLLLAQTYLTIDKTFEARNILEPLSKQYPNSTYINSMLLELFAKTKNRTGQATVKETVKMADPECSLALSLKYNELYEQKEYAKAADILDKIEKMYPHRDEYILAARLELADAKEDQNEAIKISEAAYNKYPDNKTFMTNKYFIETNLRKNVSKGIDVLKKFVDNNDNYDAARDLADAYFNAGKSAAGYKVYLDEITFDPIGVGIYSALGDIYFKQQQYPKAEEKFLSALTISPGTGKYYNKLAKIYEATGLKDKAISFYQKGLALDPSDYESIKSLRKLQAKKDVFSYFKEPDVAAIVKNAPKASDYPDDNYAVLNQDVQRVVYENGASEARQFILTKIFNQKGIDAWKEYSVGYDNDEDLTIEVAEVIKANGTKVPAEKNSNNLVFTNLEIGDIVSIRYHTENYYKGQLAAHFWDSFYFTKGCPSINLNYSLLISKNKAFTSKFSLGTIQPEKNDADEFDLYSWKTQNVKSLKAEGNMPAFSDVAQILYLTSIPDWKFISTWYNDIASAKARSNYEVKAVLNKLFDGQGKLTDAQKVEKIYNYITGTITYSSVSFRQNGIVPQNPADVINTRIGDCKDVSTLFVAMCKEAGIKAQLVLVKTRQYGLNSMLVPGIDFNHCIAKVNFNNQDLYVELTSKYLPFRSIYNQSVNSSMLDIGGTDASAGIKYLNPVNRKQNTITRLSEISFRDKDILVNGTAYETAAMAGILRAVYTDLSPTDQMKKTKEAFSQLYADNQINEFTLKNIDKADIDTVYLKLNYEIKNSIKEIAGMSVFSLPWSDKFTPSIFQIALPRTMGVDVSQMFSVDNESETITISLPQGKTLVENPKPVTLTNDIMDYSLIPSVKGNKVILTRNIKVKKDYIAADKVAEFNTFFKKVVEADNKELVMK